MLLFLTVKDTIRVVNLFNAPVAFCCPGHWFLVVLNNLLGKDLRRRGRIVRGSTAGDGGLA